MSFYFCRNSLIESRSANKPESLPWKKEQFYSLARTALKVGLESYLPELKKGPVLIPQFTCDESISPFKELGIQIATYNVDKSFRAVNLEQAIPTSGATGIMIIHYFGVPQQLDLIQDLCAKYNLILIEDNAHGFGGYWNDKRLGTFGDISIHSLRKNFPVSDGALLETKKEISFKRLQIAPSKNIGNFKENLKKLLLSLKVFRCLYQSKRIRSFYSTTHIESEHQLISDRAHQQLTGFIQHDWSQKRRAQFLIWQECAKKWNCTPIFHEVGSSAPLCYPIWVNSIEERDLWLKKLFVAGIDAYPWPTQSSNNDYWEHLICLPINPWIEGTKLASLLEAL